MEESSRVRYIAPVGVVSLVCLLVTKFLCGKSVVSSRK